VHCLSGLLIHVCGFRVITTGSLLAVFAGQIHAWGLIVEALTLLLERSCRKALGLGDRFRFGCFVQTDEA
jgi:hypothetical protein